MRHALRLVVVVAVSAAASSARAQVNVEPLRKKIREEGYSGAIEASATGRLGNIEGMIASSVGQVGWGSDQHLFYLHGRGDYTDLNKRVLVARYFLHARYNYTLKDDLIWAEVFAQQQSDRFLNLKDRELLGIGPRFALFRETAFGTFVGVAWMLEYERVSVPEGAPDAPETLYNRASTYAAVSVRTDDRVELTFTAYLQPRFARPKDYRVFVESLLSIEATKHFSVRLYGTVRHDSEPVTTIKKTDLEIRNALTVTF